MKNGIRGYKYKVLLVSILLSVAILFTGFMCIKLYELQYIKYKEDITSKRIIDDVINALNTNNNLNDIVQRYGINILEVNFKNKKNLLFKGQVEDGVAIFEIRSFNKILPNGDSISIKLGFNKTENDGLTLKAMVYPAIVYIIISGMFLIMIGRSSIRYQLGINAIIENLDLISKGEYLSAERDFEIYEIDKTIELINSIDRSLKSERIDNETLKEQLANYKVEIERLSNFREGYLKAISMDIKTPIESICGIMELIENECDDEETNLKKYVGYCRSSANSLNQILNDLLDAESIESNGKKISLIECDIGKLMEDFNKIFSLKFGLKNIFFSVVKNTEYPSELILIDAGKITRLINILLENAFNSNNAAVVVKWGIVNNTIWFNILENPKIELEASHEKIQSIDSNISYLRAFELVRTLNGNTDITIEEGGVRVISIEIPTTLKNENTTSQVEAKIQAVIIDQNRTKCLELAETLKTLNVESKTFQIPEIGYHHLSKELPDLVFMDLYLDGLSGSKLSRLVKGHGKVIPIVCMVKQSDAGKYRLGCEYFDYILSKPIDRKELDKIVNSIAVARKSTGFVG